MEPQSPAVLPSGAAAGRLAAHSLALTHFFNALREKHQKASQQSTTTATAVTNLCAQVNAISASLHQLQALLLRDGDDASAQPDSPQQQQLRAALDAALTACAFGFACLDAEIQHLAPSPASAGGSSSPPATSDASSRWRARRASRGPQWREDPMKELLRYLGGVRRALGSLVKALLVRESKGRFRLLNEDAELFRLVGQKSKALKAAWPAVKVPEPINGSEEGKKSFVDVVINSPAYRDALAAVAKKDAPVQPDAGAPEQTDVPNVENAVENGEPGPSAGQPAPETNQEADGIVQENGEPSRLQEGETVAEQALSNKSQKSAEKENSKSDNEEEAPPLPPRKQSTEEAEEEEAPPLPPRRPTVTEPAVASPSTANESTAANEPAANESNDTEAATTNEPGSSAPQIPPLTFESTTEPASEPTTEPATEPSTELTAEPTTEPAAEPVTEPATEPATAPVAEPITEPPTEPTTKPNNPTEPPHDADQTPTTTADLADPASTPDALSPHDLQIHHFWQTLLITELRYVSTLTALSRTLHADSLLRKSWPSLAKHLDGSLPSHVDELAALHARYLLQPLALQLASVVKTDLLLPVFRIWCRRAGKAYQAFCRRYPHAVTAVRATAEGDKGFRRFVAGLEEEEDGAEGGLEGMLGAPVRRLGFYCEALEVVVALERDAVGGEDGEGGGGGGFRPTKVGEYRRMLVRLRESCEGLMKAAEDAEDLRHIHRRIETINYHHVEPLDILNPSRRIVYQGPLACKTKGKGLWNQVHCVLLDNYFFWGRVERPREMWFGKYKYADAHSTA
ncbi:putative ankyrin repeat protein [Lasiodiplodia theobromae]|nr:putative ankyrin repeat protein [Lasiodiplodia theobromae]